LSRNIYQKSVEINPDDYQDEHAMSEIQWFYVNAQQEKIGPVPAEAVAQAYARGQMRLDSLVWAQHLPKWQALSEHLQAFSINITPPNTTRLAGGEEVKYAHFIHRWAAHLFDTWLLNLTALLIIGIIFLIAYLAMGPSFGPLNLKSDEIFIMGMMFFMFGYFLLYPVLSGIYHTYLEGPQKHGSFGKRFLGIAVVTDKGGAMDYAKAFARWFSSIVSHLTQSIGFVIAAFTPRRQALHDYIVGTLVVESPNPKYADISRNNRATGVLLICIFILPIILAAAFVVPMMGLIAQQSKARAQETAELWQSVAEIKELVAAKYAEDASCLTDTDAEVQGVVATLQAKTSYIGIGEQEDEIGCEIYLEYGDNQYIWSRMDEQGQWFDDSGKTTEDQSYTE
jgi:uncharacterized RDD family membrane protein YckC